MSSTANEAAVSNGETNSCRLFEHREEDDDRSQTHTGDGASPGLFGSGKPVHKVLGGEKQGFGKADVTVEEVKDRESDRVSCIASPSSSYLTENRTSNASESASWFKSAETEFHKTSLQLPNVNSTEVSNSAHGNGLNCLAKIPGTQSQRKVKKMIGSGGSRSKRLRTSQLVVFVNPKGTEELKFGSADKLGSCATNLMSPEKRLLLKQKSKRGDWKSSKFHMKAKFDASSQKLGSTIFQSASGGKNFLGLYGLKSDNQDFSGHIDDIPLNELRSGTYNCPRFSKDKRETGANTNGSFISSVRKACSLIQARKSTQSQNDNEMDGSTCPLTALHPVNGGLNEDKQQFYRIDVSSDCKASCSKAETPSLLDWPLHLPKDVLEHLALPPPRDLESLLLDATKPSASARTTDLRSSKQIARRPILPAFTWSHSFTGHCRGNFDTVKLSTSRSTCQGRWARILNITDSKEVAGGGFSNLDSLIYDETLVPSKGPPITGSCDKVFPSVSVTCPISRCHSCASLKNDYQVPQDTSQANSRVNGLIDEYSPRIVAAAQILYDIANQSSWPKTNGMLRCQKKCSHKMERACNPKPDHKFEDTLRTSIAMNGSERVRSRHQTVAAKKPKLMTFDNRGSQLSNCDKKEAVNWPVSRSSRSINGKAAREFSMEDKRSISSQRKLSFTLPPLGKDSNKVSGGQRKLGKEERGHWR